MSIQFGKINNNIFVNSTATYENGIVSISSPENAEKINFYAPSNANDSDLYEINGKQVILSNILNNNPEITWVKDAPISAVYDSENNKLFINGINGENSVFSNLFRNANAQVIENKIVINSVEEAVDLFNFYSPKAYSANDTYEVNGQVYGVVDLQGNKLESGWNGDVPVSLVLNENKLWYSSNSSDTKLPSDLSPLCPNFKVERNGGKVKISADKIQLNPYTNMVQGGVWAWGKTRPTKPTGENTKQWSRAELITMGKPYDGLYLGDVTPSDAVTETLIYLPENDSGSVKLVPCSPSYQFRFIGQDGQIGTKVGGSTLEIVPSICIPLDTPIRALADGTYDLVPEDPALAQSISTMADEEEVPLEIEIDWPEEDPLYARQWVYNTKGQYQTMLLGGVASTEDAPAYSPVLAENTWEQITQACADNDPILDSWLVGDEKDEVINGETLTFAIMGKNMDDLADGSGKAHLTFGMTQLMETRRQMNGTNTNVGSFAGSEMYSWLSGTIYPNLPTELKDAIKAVNKKTSAGDASSSIRTDAMYLWLFSEIEVFGTTTYSYAGEGTQYPYFATAAERIKRLSNGAGATSYWWERSPRRTGSGGFCDVDTSGSAGGNGASYSHGVCFGFCI